MREDLSIIQAGLFPGYTEEITFQVRHGHNLTKFIMVDVGFKPTTQKPLALPTTPFVKELVRY